jgi:type II restriction enzyme
MLNSFLKKREDKTFSQFIETLAETNQTLDSFVDFEKVKSKTSDIEIKLNTLNYLLGKNSFNRAVSQLWNSNRDAFSILNILIAVRDNKKVLDKNGSFRDLFSYFETEKDLLIFFEETGLKEIFVDKNIKNLVDYVFGIEVGLDTNARKNRSGKTMERFIASIFTENGIEFKEQVHISQFPDIVGLGVDAKVFDFVIQKESLTYLIEVNFYNSGGSKLNEVARAYKDLAVKIEENRKYRFVWITDGQGWKSAKNKLEEAYAHIPHLYNLHSLESLLGEIDG